MTLIKRYSQNAGEYSPYNPADNCNSTVHNLVLRLIKGLVPLKNFHVLKDALKMC